MEATCSDSDRACVQQVCKVGLSAFKRARPNFGCLNFFLSLFLLSATTAHQTRRTANFTPLAYRQVRFDSASEQSRCSPSPLSRRRSLGRISPRKTNRSEGWLVPLWSASVCNSPSSVARRQDWSKGTTRKRRLADRGSLGFRPCLGGGKFGFHRTLTWSMPNLALQCARDCSGSRF